MKVRELVTKKKQPTFGLPEFRLNVSQPAGDYAGRLVEAAGLKGKQIGRAQISPKHGNFIVNQAAPALKTRRLMELARAEVNAQFGAVLNPGSEADRQVVGKAE